MRPGEVLSRECGPCFNQRLEAYRAQVAAGERMAADRAVELARANPEQALAACGVPRRWLAASFDNCPDLPASIVDQLRAWAIRPDGVLFLHGGQPGSGKTWGAVSVLRDVVMTGLWTAAECRFISEGDYLEGLRAGYAKEGRTSRGLPANHPRRAALLVFDDLMSTRLTEWGRPAVAELIVGRHADALATIVTANLNLKQVAQGLDPRVASRLAEDRAVVAFPDRDLRIVGSLRHNGRSMG